MFLVTGATGFVGKNFIFEIIKRKNVRIFVRRTSNITHFKGRKEIEIAYGDLENNVGIKEALDGVDVVIHCAARTVGRNFIEYYKTNTIGTANLIKTMLQKNVKKIVYLSSHAACGPCNEKKSITETDQPKPISFYGITKKIAEDIIMQSNISYIILRPVSIYGPYDTEILKYVKLLNYGICPVIGFGEKYINLIYVNDLVQMIIKVIDVGKFDNKIFFLSDGHCYSFTEVVGMIAEVLNKNNLKIHVPEVMALFAGLLNDIFLPEKKRTIWRDKVKELAREYWLCCSESAVREFGFVPKYSLKEGMRETINWYRKQGFL